MFRNLVWRAEKRGFAVLAALLLGATLAYAGKGVDDVLAGWLGTELTIESSTLTDQIPVGGKLTFIYDSVDNVVRVCTRQVATQRKPWRSDLAVPCSVTLTFTRGTRYCTFADVNTGNGETLSTCHRLRSHEVALQPATAKGVELNDMIVFLVQAENGKHAISILVDSPSRVTTEGSAQGKEPGG
jgi:hypothetical protein